MSFVALDPVQLAKLWSAPLHLRHWSMAAAVLTPMLTGWLLAIGPGGESH